MLLCPNIKQKVFPEEDQMIEPGNGNDKPATPTRVVSGAMFRPPTPEEKTVLAFGRMLAEFVLLTDVPYHEMYRREVENVLLRWRERLNGRIVNSKDS